MKTEVKEKNKSTRDRIKQLELKDKELLGSAQALVQRGQQIQQEIAQVNTERIKIQGGIDELKRSIG